MTKQTLLFLFMVLSELLSAQSQEPLYYFITKDSLIGVKDSKNKIIVPPKHRWMFDKKNGEKVPGGLINLYFGVYNREGKFLYTPMIFDFLPDEIHEGLKRFIENGKTGFVNREGEKVIMAQFEFASWFDLGTAMVCKGCYFDTTKDLEHPPLIGGVFSFIDRNGKFLVDPLPFDTSYIFRNKLDSIAQALYPCQFRYNDFEKGILKKFDLYKNAIEKEYFKNWTDHTGSKSLVVDIVEKPSPGFPYYVIHSRELIGRKIRNASWDTLQFYITKDGKNIYYIEGRNLIAFSKWYSLYIKGKREYD